MNDFFTLAASNPVDHVLPYSRFFADMFGFKHLWVWSSITGNLVLSGVILLLVFLYAASRISTGPAADGNERYLTKNLFASMIEVICIYLRDSVVRPLLHDRTDRFMPFLWTLFFFILINNLLGLFPIGDVFHVVHHYSGGKINLNGILGGTATQNLWVTGALAVVAALVINFAGVKELGVGGYLKHLTAGTPVYLWPLMVPIEILGTIIKPVALALRLFANMTAGHILVAVLFMFAGMGIGLLEKGFGLGILGGGISLVSALAAMAIYFLELFVAFLQAFVFFFLTTVFISQLSHHHDHEHGDAHGHEHAHAH